VIALRDEPHHDGSPIYVDAAPRSLGSTVRVRLRVPDACGTTRVRLRSTPDAEPESSRQRVDRHGHGATWWAADLVLHNPLTRYRWLLDGGTLGRCWVNGAGVFHRDVTDDADFRLTTRSPEPGSRGTQSPEPGPRGTELSATAATPPPAWLADTVGYQIFIDRFADSGAPRDTPRSGRSPGSGTSRSRTPRGSAHATGTAVTSSASNSTSTTSPPSA
jgi:alpha-glucosidase